MSRKISAVLEKFYKQDSCSDGAQNDEMYPSFPSFSYTDRLHLTEYLEILRRRKWVVIIMFIIIVGAATIGSFTMPVKYEASVRILLGMQPTLMNPEGNSNEYNPAINQYYQTQVNLLSSRTLTHKVLDQFRPEQIISLIPDYRSGSLVSADNPIKNVDLDVIDPAKESEEILYRPEVVKWYLDNLKVTPIQESNLVDISFTGTDSKFVTQIINKHAQTAIEYTVHQHQNQAKEALIWLKKQIEEQKTDVQKAQLAIYEFKKKHNALSLEAEERKNDFSKEIQEINNAFAQAKSDRLKRQAVYQQLKEIDGGKGNILLLPEIANNSVVQSMRRQLTELKFKQIKLKTKYGPKHPKMVELNNGIKQLEAEISIEIERLKKTIASGLNRAKAIESSLQEALNEQKQVAMSLSEKSIEYEVLKQQAQSAQDVYDFLLKQSEQLGLSSVISSSSMKVVDLAEEPIDPVSPKILLNIVISIFVSLFSGAGLAILLEFMDNSIKTTEDISRHSGLPVLGLIPFTKDMLEHSGSTASLNGRPALEKRLHHDATTYHIANRLPEKIRGRMDRFYGRVLVVESVSAGEGKSTIAAHISSNLAEAGQRVLLVDFDFIRPTLDKIFNVSNGRSGLGQFIDHIQSHSLTLGTLKEYSVDDLFFLAGLKRLSGHMTIRNDDQTFIAHFQHGFLLHIQKKNNPESSRIGAMLVNNGCITMEQLNYALERNKRTGQPLGYILVNAGYIGRDELRGPLRLQIEEYIQKIFSWKNGVFKFEKGIIRINENEKIFFEEDFSPLINSLGRVDISKFFEKELFSHIKRVNRSNLYLLTAGKSAQSIGTLNHALVEKVFEKLKLNFDVILVDTPPLDAASGIESVFQFADDIILVVKSGKLKIKTFNEAVYHLPQDKIIGTVLNQVKTKLHTYY